MVAKCHEFKTSQLKQRGKTPSQMKKINTKRKSAAQEARLCIQRPCMYVCIYLLIYLLNPHLRKASIKMPA